MSRADINTMSVVLLGVGLLIQGYSMHELNKVNRLLIEAISLHTQQMKMLRQIDEMQMQTLHNHTEAIERISQRRVE